MKKRLKNTKLNISIISFTLIVLLSITGISYAYWTDDLKINTTVTTGSIKPYFKTSDNNTTSQLELTGKDRGELIVTVEDKEIRINGDITSDYNGNLFFDISNKGSVPIKCESINNPNTDFFKQIDISNENSNEKDIKCNFHVKPKNLGTYNFSFDLLLKQFNNSGWKKKLKVYVDVNVENPINTMGTTVVETVEEKSQNNEINEIKLQQDNQEENTYKPEQNKGNIVKESEQKNSEEYENINDKVTDETKEVKNENLENKQEEIDHEDVLGENCELINHDCINSNSKNESEQNNNLSNELKENKVFENTPEDNVSSEILQQETDDPMSNEKMLEEETEGANVPKTLTTEVNCD